MCGLADFEALNTCITRLAELSAAGAATYSVCKAARLCRQPRPGQEQPEERDSRDVPGRLALEDSSGHPDA